MVDDLTASARKAGAVSVLAIGGGSVLDAGKAVAAMLRHKGSVVDYLEGVGIREPEGLTVPMIAVPTTAGTGSEATKNAVISRRGPDGFKKSLRHDAFVPSAAVLDPELAVGCPPEVTRACGMDAFCQLLESFLSTGATPVTDMLAREGLARFASGCRLFTMGLYGRPEEIQLRGELALAAYYSGLTLANAGLGTVHGIAGPIGAFSDVPHGVACGLLLGPVFRRITAHLTDNGDTRSLNRLALAGAVLRRGDSGAGAGDPESTYPRRGDIENLLDRFDRWRDGLSKLSDYGMSENLIESVLANSDNKSSPVPLSRTEWRDAILEIM
jgi:alcohol dehydrogenase class IV